MPAKILIADDERHVAEGLQMLLADDGFEVDMATDGQAAWEIPKTRAPTPAPIIAPRRSPRPRGSPTATR